jgi:phosphoenolpyruvate carboxylase
MPTQVGIHGFAIAISKVVIADFRSPQQRKRRLHRLSGGYSRKSRQAFPDR